MCIRDSVHLELAAREHARRQSQLLGHLQMALEGAVRGVCEVLGGLASTRVAALLMPDVLGDDVDHVHVGHVLGEQPLERDHAA